MTARMETSRRTLIAAVPAFALSLALSACGSTTRTGMVTDKRSEHRRFHHHWRTRYYVWIDGERCWVEKSEYDRVTVGQRATVECN